jgi:hypothetical protein
MEASGNQLTLSIYYFLNRTIAGRRVNSKAPLSEVDSFESICRLGTFESVFSGITSGGQQLVVEDEISPMTEKENGLVRINVQHLQSMWKLGAGMPCVPCVRPHTSPKGSRIVHTPAMQMIAMRMN